MAAFAGVLCGSVAAVCYLIRLSSEEAAKYYKSVTQVNQLQDLGNLLRTANKVLVKVSGNVSSDTPINCKLSGLRGVIVEEKAYQNFLMQNDEGKWIKDETLMLSTNREVPWYLDDGSARVHIVGAYHSAADLLKVTCEAYDGPGQSCVYGTCDPGQGPKVLGVRRIERVLLTDTKLSVVGEAIKDDNGTFTIHQPGYVCHGNFSLDQYVEYYRLSACFFKHASMDLSAIGFCLIATHAFQFILDKTTD